MKAFRPRNANLKSRFGQRAGFTQVELAVVLTVVAISIALIAPAVQRTRDEARRTACENNLRVLAQGFRLHHDTYAGFPPARTTVSGHHGWCVDLLPFVDQEKLHAAYRFDKNFYDAENQDVARTAVPVYLCSASPESPRMMKLGMGNTSYGTEGIAGNYFVNHILNPMYQVNGGAAYPALQTENKFQPMSQITDGLSQTTLIHEQAGRPDYYVLKEKQPTDKGLTLPGWWGAWVSYQHFRYQAFAADGKKDGWECAINCNNGQGIYSFHPGGSLAAFCDGSVRFLSEKTAAQIVFALASRNGGELLSPEDYASE